jgi:hypothetical protein
MLEVELGLLADGSIGVERRLDAVPQHAHVHGRESVLVERRGVARPGDMAERAALEAGAV